MAPCIDPDDIATSRKRCIKRDRVERTEYGFPTSTRARYIGFQEVDILLKSRELGDGHLAIRPRHDRPLDLAGRSLVCSLSQEILSTGSWPPMIATLRRYMVM